MEPARKIIDSKMSTICTSTMGQGVVMDISSSDKETLTRTRTYVCGVCFAHLHSKEALRNHIVQMECALKETKQLFVCDKCDETFHSKVAMKIHRRTHKDPGAFQCNKCDKTFASKLSLGNHSKVHNRIRSIICLECDKAFFYQAHLNSHLTKVHKKEKTFSCSTCSASYFYERELEQHLKEEFPSRSTRCLFCTEEAPSYFALQVHMKSVHDANLEGSHVTQWKS